MLLAATKYLYFGRKTSLTACHVDKVFARGLVNLNVAVANVVLVPFECQVSVLNTVKKNNGLSIPATLTAEAESHTSPGYIEAYEEASNILIGGLPGQTSSSDTTAGINRILTGPNTLL